MMTQRASDRALSIGLNAHLFSRQPGYRNAGISQYIYGLLRYLPLADARPKYSAYMHERSGTLTGIRRVVSSWNTHRPTMRILWEQFMLPIIVRRDELDILHGLAYALPLLSHVPGVVTVYDLTFFHLPEAFRPMNRLYLRWITRRSVQRAAHVCAISQSTRRDVIRLLNVPADRVSVIYPGIAARFERPASEELASFRRRHGLPPRFVLYLGTLEPRKNITALIRAYAALQRAGERSVHLVIAGAKGWYFRNIFAEVERLGLQQTIHFPGYVPAAEQPFWYAAADLFVYPSQYEGFGMPVAEAMACGTPVLTSTAASLPEVVGDAGVTVPPNDITGLAGEMARILRSESLRVSLGAAGRRRAQQFSWQQAAQKQVAIYNEVASHPGGGQ